MAADRGALYGAAPVRAHMEITTEKHYKPWVKTLQDKLEVDAMKGWPAPPPKPASKPKTQKRASR